MAKIKVFSYPSWLYRYRQLNAENYDQEIRTILEGHLYFSDFRALNDPMEGLFRQSLGLVFFQQDKANADDFEKYRATLGIVSLTESWRDFSMWAHYADQFRGMCISYNTRNLLNGLPDDIDLVRVSYDDEAPKLFPDRSSDTLALAKSSLATKHTAWSHEREWRFISQSFGPIQMREAGYVQVIYVGMNMNEKILNKLVEDMRPLGISVRQIKACGYELQHEHLT
jgi:hypothetical protein